MKINRHKVQHDLIERLFRREIERFDEFYISARQKVQNLTLFHDFVASNVYLAGAVVLPDSSEVARALLLSAQALGAIFAFSLEPPPDDYELGEGPPVQYSAPIDPSIPDILLWRKAYDLALIARQTVPLDYLCRVTKETFQGSSLVGYTDEEYWLMELKQRAWQDPNFGWEPLLAKCETLKSRSAECSDLEGIKHVQCLGIPYLLVLRKLCERDSLGLETVLTEALKLHKQYWSAKASRRKEEVGFVSLPLLGLAALAWDRGLRFKVESDYLPWSWVTGEVFGRTTGNH